MPGPCTNTTKNINHRGISNKVPQSISGFKKNRQPGQQGGLEKKMGKILDDMDINVQWKTQEKTESKEDIGFFKSILKRLKIPTKNNKKDKKWRSMENKKFIPLSDLSMTTIVYSFVLLWKCFFSGKSSFNDQII